MPTVMRLRHVKTSKGQVSELKEFVFIYGTANAL